MKDFWSKVDIKSDNECWLWRGRNGPAKFYGRFKGRQAHQVAWELKHGKPWPKGKVGCHTCDNPPCVNPNHIWPGSKWENTKDAWEKGRWAPWLSLKTHCKNGHELSGDNLHVRPSSGGSGIQRVCKTCRREQAKKDNKKYEARRSK